MLGLRRAASLWAHIQTRGPCARQEEERPLVIEVASNDPLDKIQVAKERDIRFVELQFTDLLGIVKGITIPLYRLEESLEHGTWFDGSSIEGFTRIAESDQWLAPDMSTFAEIPWQRRRPGRRPARQPRHGPRHLRRHDPRRPALRGRPARRAQAQLDARRGHGLHLERRPGAGVLPVPQGRRRQRIAPLPHDRAATSTSAPTSPRPCAATWSTRSRRSASASRPPTTRSPTASTRSTSSTATA